MPTGIPQPTTTTAAPGTPTTPVPNLPYYGMLNPTTTTPNPSWTPTQKVFFAWSERVGNESPGADGFSTDGGTSCTMVADLPWNMRLVAVQQILGYSFVQQNSTNVAFLRREMPMRHPYHSWLFASDVQVQGIKVLGREGSLAQHPALAATSTTAAPTVPSWMFGKAPPYRAEYQLARFTVTFAPRPYKLIADTLDSGGNADYPAGWNESDRFVSLDTEAQVEALQAEVGNFTYAEGGRRGTPFPNKVSIYYPRLTFKLTWHQVPESFIFDGLLPRRFARAAGCVNSRPFYGMPVGTLRLDPPQFARRISPVLPVGGQASFFYDVTMTLHYFDPPRADTSSPWRGHNLVVGPRERVFYLATHNGNPPTLSDDGVPSGSADLLDPDGPGQTGYNYYDFNRLFNYWNALDL